MPSCSLLIVVSDEELKRRVAEELALEQAKKESESQKRWVSWYVRDFGGLVIIMTCFKMVIRLIICVCLDFRMCRTYALGCFWFGTVLFKALHYPLPKLDYKWPLYLLCASLLHEYWALFSRWVRSSSWGFSRNFAG